MSWRDDVASLAPNFNKLSHEFCSMCITSNRWQIGSFCHKNLKHVRYNPTLGKLFINSVWIEQKTTTCMMTKVVDKYRPNCGQCHSFHSQIIGVNLVIPSRSKGNNIIAVIIVSLGLGCSKIQWTATNMKLKSTSKQPSYWRATSPCKPLASCVRTLARFQRYYNSSTNGCMKTSKFEPARLNFVGFRTHNITKKKIVTIHGNIL